MERGARRRQLGAQLEEREETKEVGWNACSIGTVEVFHFSFPLEQLCIIGGSSWPVATSTCCTTNRRIARRRETTAPFKRPFPREGGGGSLWKKERCRAVLGSDFRRFVPLEKPDVERCQRVRLSYTHSTLPPPPTTFSRYWISMDSEGMGVVIEEGDQPMKIRYVWSRRGTMTLKTWTWKS